MNAQVAKDYSQPEVRRQQDEDKRLRLQVSRAWRVALFDFGSGSGRVMVKSPGSGSGSGRVLGSVNQDSWRVYLTLLSHLVRIVFPVPAASSKSERVFSAAGNVVTAKRASLNPEKVEDLVIVKCNLSLLKGMGMRKWSHYWPCNLLKYNNNRL